MENYLKDSAYKQVDSDFFKNGGWEIVDLKIPKTIEELLQDYTIQKQINEEHQKINGELREKVKELDTKNDELLKDLYSANCIIADLTDSIPIQKIQDKIEELDRKIRYEKNERLLIYLHKQKKVLQELLQESEAR